jgi:hypothetical protein
VKFTAYLNNEVIKDTDKFIYFSDLPEGAYVYKEVTKAWYHVRFRNGMPINLSDVPKELRLLRLISS